MQVCFSKFDGIHSEWLRKQTSDVVVSEDQTEVPKALKHYNLKVCQKKINITCTHPGCRLRFQVDFDWSVGSDGLTPAPTNIKYAYGQMVWHSYPLH